MVILIFDELNFIGIDFYLIKKKSLGWNYNLLIFMLMRWIGGFNSWLLAK